MSFLPIVERELRVRGRAKGTYRGRIVAALAATACAGLVLLAAEGARGGKVTGAGMLSSLGWLIFFFCLFQGVRNTADCLSEEKRAGTLGLLFLTDLRGYDVVLGKLLATSLNSFYALLAVFPPLGIAIVLGGVTMGEFWRMVLALIVTLLFAITAGIFVSSMVRDERRAISGTALLTAFFVGAVPLLQPLVPLPFSPTCAFLSWLDLEYSVQTGYYWTAVLSSLVMSAAFIVTASFILPHAWQERPGISRRTWLFRNRNKSVAHRTARRRLLEVNPVVWLATRAEQQAFLMWSLVLAGSTIGILLWVMSGGIQVVAFSVLFLFLLLHLLLSMWAASEACAVFPAARDSGALELLLSTPVTLREIIDGHVIGLRRLFQRPLIALLSAEVILLAAYLIMGTRNGMTAQKIEFTILAVGLCLTTAVMDLFAVTRYGMWVGLIEKRRGWAVTRTILVVLLMPMFLAGLFSPCAIVLWPVIGVAKNLFFIARAKELLDRNLRGVLTEGFGTTAAAGPLETMRLKRAGESELPPVLPR